MLDESQQLTEYIMKVIRNNKDLMDEVDDDEWIEDIENDLKKEVQHYQQILLKRSKGSKHLKKIMQEILEELDNDKNVQNRILKLNEKPLFQAMNSIVPKKINLNDLFCFGVQVEKWEIQTIIKNNLEKQRKIILQYIEQSSTIQQFIYSISNYVIDCLIRRLEISSLVNSINKVAKECKNKKMKNLGQFETLTTYDFLVLFVQSIDQTQHSFIGNLLQKNKLPIPLINRSINNAIQKTHYFPYLLEEILPQNKFRLIFSLGMQDSRTNEKQSLIYNSFKIDMESTIQSNSTFNDGCVSFHVNNPINYGKSIKCVVAIYHRLKQLKDIKERKVQLFLKHSSVIILHITNKQFHQKKESNCLKTRINQVKKGQILFVVYGSNEIDSNDQNVIFYPSKSKKLDKVDRSNWIQKMHNKIANLLVKKNKINSINLRMDHFIEESSEEKFTENIRIIQGLIQKLNKDKNKPNFYGLTFPFMESQRIIKQKENKKNICLSQLNYSSLMDQSEVQKRFLQLESLQQKLKDQSKKITKSQNSKTIQYFIQNLQKCELQNYVFYLAEWKNRETEQIQKNILSLKAQLKQNNSTDKQQKLRKLTQKYELYDISIDTFVQQVIVSQQNAGKKNEMLRLLISKYYQRLYKKLCPINLIEGKTLKYGNQIIQEFFFNLNKEINKKKKIFVVSIIGAQSSAKSTLLNYLFMCNFATSAGRCTKGVYFTILEKEDCLIIVIDTEGLLSICSRDHLFDVQITSFILLISDIVIINSKGQINTTIEDLLGVCIYCLKQLNNKSKPIIKNKIIFAIRDLSDQKLQKQQLLLSNLIQSLKKETDLINFSDYIDITQNDMYPLQSAFTKKNLSEDLIVECCNSCFGQSILALREKIMKLLWEREPRFINAYQFYSESKRKWDAIRQCGHKIFNYKSIMEIRVKLEVKQIMEEILSKYQKQFEDKCEKISNNLQQTFENNQIENMCHQINEITKICIEGAKRQLQNRTEQIKGIKADWINDMCEEIEDQFKYKNINAIQFMKKQVNQKHIKHKKQLFEQKIYQIIQNIYVKDQNQETTLKNFEIKYYQLIQIQNKTFQKKIISIQRQLKRQIDNKLGNIIKQNGKIMGSSYRQAQKCLRKLYKTDRSMIINSESLKAIQNLILREEQIFIQGIKKIIQKQKYQQILNMQQLFMKIEKQSSSFISNLQNKVQSFIRNWYFTSVKVNKQNLRQYSFLIIQEIVPNQIEIQLQKHQKEQKKRQKQIFSTKRDYIMKAFKNKGNAEAISKEWLNQIRTNILEKYLTKLQQSVKKKVNKVIYRINPVKMIEQALRLSFKSDQYGKKTWLNCYKVAVNINEFLKKDILYERDEIKGIERELSNGRNRIIKQMKEQYQNYDQLFKQAVQTFNSTHKIQHYAKKFGIQMLQLKSEQNQAILEKILIILNSQFTNTIQYSNQSFDNEVYKNNLHFQRLNKKIWTIVENEIQPQTIGCQAICPLCSIKCKKIRNHKGGHSAVQNSHLMYCFGGISYKISGQRCQSCCFTHKQCSEGQIWTNYNGQRVLMPTLQFIEKKHPKWLQHFKQGPYQQKVNEERCQRVWSNIGEVLIKKHYKRMKNNNMKEEYYDKANALKLQDVDKLIGYD